MNEVDEDLTGIEISKFVRVIYPYLDGILGQEAAHKLSWSEAAALVVKHAQAAPALLAALTEGIGLYVNSDFAADLEAIADFLNEAYHPFAADKLRAKAQAIRAAVADGVARRGQATGEAN